MPIYEYRCERCGKTFEVIQKFSDTPLTVHEKCGGRVERLISAPSFQFKGSGWYVTDYPHGKSSSKKEDGAANGEKSESKTESKPETKSEKSESKSDSKPASESKPPAATKSD